MDGWLGGSNEFLGGTAVPPHEAAVLLLRHTYLHLGFQLTGDRDGKSPSPSLPWLPCRGESYPLEPVRLVSFPSPILNVTFP